MSDPANEPIVPRCHLPLQQMVIDSTGWVSPCCCNRHSAVGNVNEQSIEEIWNGSGYQRLRKHMAEGDLVAAGCDDCLALKQGIPLPFAYDRDSESDDSTPYAQNIMLLKEEIARGEVDLQAKPTIISLTPSHRCNIRCAHCYQESTRSLDMARREVNQEVLDLAPYLVRLIAGGGEPFLMPLWRRFLKEFDRADNPYLDFATTTNGTLITSEVEEGLDKFKKVTLNISLDGTGKVFEAIRVGADFEKVRENIRKLRAIAHRAESPLSTMGVTMCVMKSNVKDLPNLIRFAAEEEITYGLNPVRKQPPDESLACFNDPHAETQGWQETFEEAKRVACEVYFPILNRLGKLPEHEDYRTVLLHHIEVVRQCTPWHLFEKEHYRVRVEVPWPTLATASSDVPPGQRLMAHIFPDGTSVPPLYYAFFTDNGFEVSLPAGEYRFSISSKWVLWTPMPDLQFAVKKGWRNAKVIYPEHLQPITFWLGVRRQIMAYMAALPGQVTTLWDRLRRKVKAGASPFPSLFRVLKRLDLLAYRWAAMARKFLS